MKSAVAKREQGARRWRGGNSARSPLRRSRRRKRSAGRCGQRPESGRSTRGRAAPGRVAEGFQHDRRVIAQLFKTKCRTPSVRPAR